MRRLPAVVLLVAVCAAAAGCTTVSAPPPRGQAPRTAGRPDRPDDWTVKPSPPHEVLGTTRPDRRASATASPGPAPTARPYTPAHRDRPTAPHRRQPRSAPPTAIRFPVPGGGYVCALGETYGDWAADSQAARICRQAYGR